MAVTMDGIFVNGQKATFRPEDILSGDASAYTEEIGAAVEAWMEENVTGGEQVTDTTLTLPGVPADAKKVGDELADVKEDLNVFRPTATSADVGKALIVKAVVDGVPTEFEYGETDTSDLEERISAIENLEIDDFFEDVIWEIGSISTGGTDISNDNRLRTVGYIPIADGTETIPFKLTNNAVVGIQAFNSEKTSGYLADSGWQTGTDGEYLYTVPTNAKFVRLVLRRSDNKAFTDTTFAENITSVKETVLVKTITDLAETIENTYTKAETYSSAEVDGILSDFGTIDLLNGITWELGNLNVNTGAEENSSTVIRTPFLTLPKLCESVSAKINNGNYKLFFYDASRTCVEYSLDTTYKNWSSFDIINRMIPSNAVYIRATIRDVTSVSDGSKLTLVADSFVSSAKVDTDEMIGSAPTWEYGAYYANISLGGLESAVEERAIDINEQPRPKRSLVNLPADHILRIYGVGVSTTRKLYHVFDASTGVLIDQYAGTDATKAKVMYLRYGVDTRVYITVDMRYTSSVRILDPIGEMHELLKAVPSATTPIMDMNGADYVEHAIKSLRRGYHNQRRQAVLVHISDLHGDGVNLKRAVDFVNDARISTLIDDTICSGDIHQSYLSDGMAFFDAVSGAEKILLCTGNHDVVKTGNVQATVEEVYNGLFANRISNWGVTQPSDVATSFAGYYYKDYATPKLRVIVLDSHHDNTYLSAQATWLADTLAGAKTAGYSVICVNHYGFNIPTLKWVDCSFSPAYKTIWNWFGQIPDAFESAVDNFITGGGDFVCWLAGHAHDDYVIKNASETQLCIGVSCTTHDTGRISGEDLREEGTKSQDCINVIGVDTYSKRISILRVGNDTSRFMQSKHHLCIDYSAKTVVWND